MKGGGGGSGGGTIWESASRPLFVRSVWLETGAQSAYERPSQRQRHFILDRREAGEGGVPPKGATGAAVCGAHQSSKRRCRNGAAGCAAEAAASAVREAVFDDLECVRGYDEEVAALFDHHPPEDVLLIGSAKAHFRPTPAPTHGKAHALHAAGKFGRPARISFPPTAAKASRLSHAAGQARLAEYGEFLSRRSSFQDLQSTLSQPCSNPDERLAERVLNWLDLAGKADGRTTPPAAGGKHAPPTAGVVALPPPALRKQPTHPRSMHTAQPALPHAALPLLTAHRRYANARKRVNPNKTNLNGGGNHNNSKSHYSCHHQRSDPMKHITIIFNKEGIPVRLNRPARNIDLCTLASSAGTTRRLAGALASARLYKSCPDYGPGAVSGAAGTAPRPTPAGAKPAGATVRRQQTPRRPNGGNNAMQENGTDEAANRIAHYTPRSGAMHEARKQLHIFMPSLPKKGLLAASLISGSSLAGGGGAEDVASGLSGSFNELCKL